MVLSVKSITKVAKRRPFRYTIIGGPTRPPLEQGDGTGSGLVQGRGRGGAPCYRLSLRRSGVSGLTEYGACGGGADVRSNPRSLEKDLDGFAPPSWDLMDPKVHIDAHREKDRVHHHYEVPSRAFCSARIIAGREIRKRSADNVMER